VKLSELRYWLRQPGMVVFLVRHRAVGSRRRGPARLGLLIVLLADPRSWHSRADAKAKRRIIGEWLAKLQADLDMAVEQMPEDWDETSCNGISFAAPSCSISTAPRIACAASPITTRCGAGL
jgi:hypothetical protein